MWSGTFYVAVAILVRLAFSFFATFPAWSSQLLGKAVTFLIGAGLYWELLQPHLPFPT